jgi:hypothetical protein
LIILALDTPVFIPLISSAFIEFRDIFASLFYGAIYFTDISQFKPKYNCDLKSKPSLEYLNISEHSSDLVSRTSDGRTSDPNDLYRCRIPLLKEDIEKLYNMDFISLQSGNKRFVFFITVFIITVIIITTFFLCYFHLFCSYSCTIYGKVIFRYYTY